MKERGIKFVTGSFPDEINFENKKFNVHFKGKKNLKYDLVMEALGREPNVKSLNLIYSLYRIGTILNET